MKPTASRARLDGRSARAVGRGSQAATAGRPYRDQARGTVRDPLLRAVLSKSIGLDGLGGSSLVGMICVMAVKGSDGGTDNETRRGARQPDRTRRTSGRQTRAAASGRGAEARAPHVVHGPEGRIAQMGTGLDLATIREHLRSLGGELQRVAEQISEAEQAVAERAAAPEAVTLKQLAEDYAVDPALIVEFVRTLGEALAARPDTQQPVKLDPQIARRGALLSVAEIAWQDTLGPLLDTPQARQLLDVSRQRVHELAGARRLIVLRDRSGRLRFPVFQFRDAEPDARMVEAFWLLAEYVSDWTAASWMVTPSQALDGASPVTWLRDGGDPELVRALAGQDAERFAH
jgi:hypothetical protein